MSRKRGARPGAVDRRLAERRDLEARLEAFLSDPGRAVEDVDALVDDVGARGALVVPALVRALAHPDPRRRAVARAILSAVLDVDALLVLAKEARRPEVPAAARQDALVLMLAVDPEARADALDPEELDRAARGSMRAVFDGLLLDPASAGDVASMYADLPADARLLSIEEAGRAEAGADPDAIDERRLLAGMALRSTEEDPALRERIVDLLASVSPAEALFALGIVERSARDDAEARAARRHAMRLRTAGHAPRERLPVALRTGCDSEGRQVLALARPWVAGNWDVLAARLTAAGVIEEIVRQPVGLDPIEALDRTGILVEDVPLAPAPWSEVAGELSTAVEAASGLDPELVRSVRRATEETGDETPRWADPEPADEAPSVEGLRDEHALFDWAVEMPPTLRAFARERADEIVGRGGTAKTLRVTAALARDRLEDVPDQTWREMERRIRHQARALAACGWPDRGRSLVAAANRLASRPVGGPLAELLVARGMLRVLIPEEDADQIRRPIRSALLDAWKGTPTKEVLLALDVACVAAAGLLESLPHLERSRNDLGRVLFASFEVGLRVAKTLATPRKGPSLPVVDGSSYMPSDAVRAVETAVKASLAENLADAGRAATSDAVLEVVAFLRTLCFGQCPHACPANLGAPAGMLLDDPAPWETK